MVDPKGEWCASGWHDLPSWEDALNELNWEAARGEARYWVTLELPVPPPALEPTEIEAKLVEAVK